MHFTRNVTYIPASAIFTDADDKIEGTITYGKQICIPLEYCVEHKKKDAKRVSSQPSSSNTPQYSIEMVSTKTLKEGERKIDSGKRSQKSKTGGNKFAPYHPPAKKFERPTRGKKIIFIRKDVPIVASLKTT